MSRERTKESFVIENLENQVQRRLGNSDKPESKVDRFSLIMHEIFPLVNDAMGSDGDFDHKKQRLIKNVTLQNRITDDLSDTWGVDQDQILGSESRSLLGRSISQMISEHGDEVRDPDLIMRMCTIIDEVVSEHPFVRKIALDSSALDSDDILVSLRLSSFPGLYKSRNLLKKIGLSDEDQRHHLDSIFTAAIALSRDIAYNYDPAGTIWDRERLFISALPYCIDFCTESWVDLASDEIDEDIIAADIDLQIEALELTRKAVDEMDMGYDNVNHSRKNLYQRFINGIFPHISIGTSGQFPKLSRKLMAFKLAEYDKVLAECWVKASDSLINRFEEMSEEEQERFLESEGKEPMPLNEFWEFFREMTAFNQGVTPDWTFDQSDIIGIASKRLVALWGMADSICKVRKVSQ